ncbi:Exocyst complex component S3A, partial [Turnera subulata]
MFNSNSNINNNNVLISVSEDDSDEQNRMRARVRRKRKKQHGHRAKGELPQRVVRFLLRYWMVMIFLAAAGLLVFEASRIGKRPSLDRARQEIGELKKPSSGGDKKPGKVSLTNLNRIDPPRCLKLLPTEELERLDFPVGDNDVNSPVKNVVYLVENDVQNVAGNINISEQSTGATRFNLFTGYQTVDQREKSFEVNETVSEHCGFYSENGGFKISDEDKSYMETCKAVVSTCAFGGGDDLYQPIGMSEASLKKVCYVAFWDEITLAAQEFAGRRIGEDHYIGKWRIIVVKDLPFTDQRLNGKVPKMLGHRLFPHAKFSIWVDSKSQFRRDPLGVMEALLWRSNSVLAISEHGARSSVYDEARAVVQKHKATSEEVEVQLTKYRQDGLPEDKRFNGKKALNEASVIVREHTPLTNMFMCLWFNEVVRFTSRDQLSFPYVLWRLKVLKDINRFPVCIRKDLVNSMGHVLAMNEISLAILAVVLLALLSPIPHHKNPSKDDHSSPWLALSLYIQQPYIPTPNVQPHAQADAAGAFIFHRTLTEGPENTSRVVGKAQGFIIPVEHFAHSGFNIIYLTFNTPHYSGSLSIQAKHVEHKEREELTVVGGTGSFAFARGHAIFAQTDTESSLDVDATYHKRNERKEEMAKSSADDEELKRACEAAIEGTKQKIVMSIRVAKSRGIWGKSGKLGRHMAKPRPAKLYKLKHLSKVEVITNDPSGCTFTLGFDNLRSQSVAPPQWTMRNIDDRNRLLFCILNICKDVLGRLPKVVGIDVVEMALWAKENTPTVTKKANQPDGPIANSVTVSDLKVTFEKELVSQAEEEDMEALLGTYVMGIGEAEAFSERLKRELQALEAANVHAILETEPLVEEIETRNNKLEMQSVNNKALIEELDKLLERLHVPSEEVHLMRHGCFKTLKHVKEKRAELEKLKATFVRRASEFLRNYFASLVDFMISDKSYFSQRGQLKRPDHADLRYKCRTYARLLQHLKAREFANELRASTKASRNPTVWLEASAGSSQSGQTDTSSVSEAYAKMLTIFIPLLVDESSFFAHFMCFEVPALVPPGGAANGNKGGSSNDDEDDDDLGIMDIDENDSNAGKNSADLAALNESLQDLLDGIQEDFYAVVDWAYKIDPLRCISMHGITERYLSGQKADAAGFVRLLLGDLESRISMQFGRFVDEACHQIERNERNVRQMGVLSYIPRFATLATRMEQYIQGQSRDLVDQAYMKFVSIMFVTLEKIAQTDLKYADIFLLENYAAFQNSLYDLANVVPTLAKFYHQASESYEQACTRHISMIIYYQFERLFQFARRVEDLMYTITPEELGLSKADLRKVLKASLSGVDKSISLMYKKLQKNLTSEELLPSLWDKCKLVAKIYPNENVPSVAEMRELLASMSHNIRHLYEQTLGNDNNSRFARK